MLRDEMQRARRKIQETAKKAEEVEQMQIANDEAFRKKKEDEKMAEEKLREFAQNKPKIIDDIKERRYQMYLEKRKEAENLKKERIKLRQEFITVKEDIAKGNQ